MVATFLTRMLIESEIKGHIVIASCHSYHFYIIKAMILKLYLNIKRGKIKCEIQVLN